MSNLKEKILQSLKNNKQIENMIEIISKSQENLLKNYSNPVFNKSDKNNILKEYKNLQNIGESLYKYNILQTHNRIDSAEEEKGNIEDIILKDDTTHYYIWHAENEENTCDVCRELDGQIFDYYEEVPQRLHPNCRCKVEVVKGKLEPNEGESDPQPKVQQTKTWIMPCDGRISSGYGKRKPPVPGASAWHNGWDIDVPIGTSVKAIADGKVIATGSATGYGYWVAIDHGIINGVQVTSEYGHISSWNVKYGQIIKQGDIIAKSGNTGYSSGPHLHITIREGSFQGTAVDPSKYIKTNF